MLLHELSLTEIIAKIKSKELSQKEVYEHFRARINSLDPKIEAFDGIQEFAGDKSIDSPLAGIPLGVKEVYSEK
jgi:Asp-tRNA(Asn)/Glu-tRNA(Gln) amidotransferase A subunit family amidase